MPKVSARPEAELVNGHLAAPYGVQKPAVGKTPPPAEPDQAMNADEMRGAFLGNRSISETASFVTAEEKPSIPPGLGMMSSRVAHIDVAEPQIAV